jgi:hypothetical protein
MLGAARDKIEILLKAVEYLNGVRPELSIKFGKPGRYKDKRAYRVFGSLETT